MESLSMFKNWNVVRILGVLNEWLVDWKLVIKFLKLVSVKDWNHVSYVSGEKSSVCSMWDEICKF